jgi:hypothetical protein
MEKRTTKRSKFNLNKFYGSKHGNFNATDEKVLEFVLEKT